MSEEIIIIKLKDGKITSTHTLKRTALLTLRRSNERWELKRSLSDIMLDIVEIDEKAKKIKAELNML
jgi:hypothetical protein